IGNANYIVLDSRGDFGYIGNMGSLPSDLEDLYKKGSQPAYDLTVKMVGVGWKGPYITPLIIENVDSLKKDPFGNDYVYSTTEYIRSSDGEVVVAKITSKGADGTVNTSDDRSVEILKREVFATVTGTVTSPDGAALEDAAVTLNIPASGALTTRSATTDSSGNYSFSDVPFGVSSVEIEATADTGSGTSGLSYVAGSAVTINSNTEVQFQASNLGEGDVTVTNITVEFTGGSKFYHQIDWSGVVVWDSDIDGGGIRGGNGDVATFTPSQTIVGTAGGATASSTKLVRVEESSATAATAILGSGAGTGGQVTVTIGPFYSNPTGGGTSSMKSNTFTITFSDGSVITFDT
ncbi:MAG: carboxypeptidase regulatory-like domain-containing protein, partial [Candidatus Brocadiales bacterium]